MLDRSLRHARLSDFGLAKEQQAHGGASMMTTTCGVVGSPGSMAPELLNRPASERSDTYALGVIFLEMLTGQIAWDPVNHPDKPALVDRAVSASVVADPTTAMHDPNADWPMSESTLFLTEAIAMTEFDPQKRKTLGEVERSEPFRS